MIQNRGHWERFIKRLVCRQGRRELTVSLQRSGMFIDLASREVPHSFSSAMFVLGAAVFGILPLVNWLMESWLLLAKTSHS